MKKVVVFGGTSGIGKATKQIFKAIKRKKRVAYISKRWSIIALVLKLVPGWLLKKVI